VSATPIDPPAGRFLRSVPTTGGPDDAGFLAEDDGYWCSCSSSVVPFPSGEIVLLGIDGELDTVSMPAVAAALERTLSSPASHIVVSLSGLVFCGARGAALFVDAGTKAAWLGIGYSISGAPAQLRGLWSTLFPAVHLPAQFPTAGRALVDALTHPASAGRA
jgi:anti-anti-sigma regulatory factor